MDMNRRALYNSLRMNWILNPSFEAEAWQVEDYRAMPLDLIFEKLEDHHIHLDKTSFQAFADTVDTPEELTEGLLADSKMDMQEQDQVYLLIFELWRRLLPEKPCLSIFCDEMDHQINLYDRGKLQNSEAIEDALANLEVLLDENTDSGVDPHEAFEYINSCCANDVESFLFDFISEQIDNENEPYAADLLDGFSGYVRDVKWFEILRARLLSQSDPEEANHIVEQLIENTSSPDIEFYLEVLSFLVSSGDKDTFERLVKQAAELIQIEEDFQTLISLSADFYHRLDHEKLENALQQLLDKRIKIDLDRPFDRKDPQFAEFFNMISFH